MAASQSLLVRIVGFLTRLFGRSAREVPQGRESWGRRVNVAGLRDLYAPQQIRKFNATPGGIDNLALSSQDTFFIPGRGEFTVGFDGYFKVAREDPTSREWATADFYVNMVDMQLSGRSNELGPMQVRLNPEVVSSGQVFAAGSAVAAAKCRIATGAVFSLPDQQMSLFNKEPILLMNDAIESVPPVEDPNGEARIYRLPLYDTRNPDGPPAAYLTRLRYTVGNYLTSGEVDAIRTRVGRGLDGPAASTER
jgi:hypothetical protein